MAARHLAKKPRLFTTIYEARPTALGAAAHAVTKFYASMRPHPFYERTQRRLAAFDNSKLHILVIAPLSISKSAYIRTYAARRVRAALAEALRERGWNWDGSVRQGGDGLSALSGGYRITLVNQPFALTATMDEVRESCRSMVGTMEQNQKKLSHDRSRPVNKKSGTRPYV